MFTSAKVKQSAFRQLTNKAQKKGIKMYSFNDAQMNALQKIAEDANDCGLQIESMVIFEMSRNEHECLSYSLDWLCANDGLTFAKVMDAIKDNK